MPNTTVQPERKPAFARPSGTTTSATAPAAKRNTTTDSSTASNNRCKCSSLESLLTPTQPVHIKYKIKISVKTQISFNICSSLYSFKSVMIVFVVRVALHVRLFCGFCVCIRLCSCGLGSI